MGALDDSRISENIGVELGPDPEAHFGPAALSGMAGVVGAGPEDDGAEDGIFYGTDPLAGGDGLDAQDVSLTEAAADDLPPAEPPLDDFPPVEPPLDAAPIDAALVVDVPGATEPVGDPLADPAPDPEAEAEPWVDPLPEPLADEAEPDWDESPTEADLDLDEIG
ncbi:hypothetical protein ACVGVM_08630 [Pseudonocardia bannensis]|uniref:Uncharacterized protein n=1 Tax=Pseudonocardia bannensis TaxID=630973 RepID=A0A848DL61_9PSEU|nr:hypothetical protein [Pseudonocardia bannensis]NMH93477.1 hypothetical protein [Pseudonocardia bannensis]